jgi:hypothetical protein
MYTPTLTQDTDAIKLLSVFIRKQLMLDAIYCLAFTKATASSSNFLFPQAEQLDKRQHYTLLLLADTVPPNFIADMTETICQKFSGVYGVTLLVYPIDDVARQGSHSWFLHQVMQKGIRAYRCKSRKTLLGKVQPAFRDPKQLALYWDSRRYMATCFLEAEAAIENPNADTPQVVLMHVAIEHLCLGLIFLFTGYRPSSFGLSYLLRLCAIFTPIAEAIFPQKTKEDKRLLALLSQNIHTLRHRPHTETSVTDVEILRDRTHTFREQATQLAEEKIEELRITFPPERLLEPTSQAIQNQQS